MWKSAIGRISLMSRVLVIVLAITACMAAQQQQQQAQLPQQQQQPQQAPDMSVHVKVVNVPATVRDKHGKIVHNLTRDDFILEDQGQPQTIQYFSQESDLPLTLGLMVDTSGSQRRVLPEERTAAADFLNHMLRPEKDQAFLIHFDREVELLQDLTSSRDKLQAALRSMDAPQFHQTGQTGGGNSPGGDDGGQRRRGGGGGGQGRSGGGTLLYDAVYLAGDELMSKQTGRKALIVLTDGVDRGSKESLYTAIEAAQRADTVVYSILFKDEQPFGGGFGGRGGGGFPGGGRRGGMGRYPQEQRPDGKKILEQISKQTGGRVFEPSSGKDSLDKIFSQIEEELRSQYSLGYPPPAADSLGYRKITLKTKQKDLIVQARDGYYPH